MIWFTDHSIYLESFIEFLWSAFHGIQILHHNGNPFKYLLCALFLFLSVFFCLRGLQKNPPDIPFLAGTYADTLISPGWCKASIHILKLRYGFQNTVLTVTLQESISNHLFLNITLTDQRSWSGLFICSLSHDVLSGFFITGSHFILLVTDEWMLLLLTGEDCTLPVSDFFTPDPESLYQFCDSYSI